jgi:hypothetical protein
MPRCCDEERVSAVRTLRRTVEERVQRDGKEGQTIRGTTIREERQKKETKGEEEAAREEVNPHRR